MRPQIAAVRQAVLNTPSLRKLDDLEVALDKRDHPPQTRNLQTLLAWQKEVDKIESAKESAIKELDSFIRQLQDARRNLKEA